LPLTLVAHSLFAAPGEDDMRARRLTGSTILTALLLAPGAPAIALPAAQPAMNRAGAVCPARGGWTMLTQASALARHRGPRGAMANWVGVDNAGGLTWNGSPIDRRRLAQFFDIVANISPQPALVIDIVAGGDCAAAYFVAAAAESANVCTAPRCVITTGPIPRTMMMAPAPPAPRRRGR
jgi:hypothetical protein